MNRFPLILRRVVLRVGIVMFISFIIFSDTAEAVDVWPIIPGKGIDDKITLDMPLSAMDQLLTRSKTSKDLRNIVYWVWYKEGIQAHIAYNKVYQLVITSSRATIKGKDVDLVARGGIRIGATLNDITKVYGRNYLARTLKTAKSAPKQVYYVYPPQGIGFVLKAGRLYQIWIWPAKK